MASRCTSMPTTYKSITTVDDAALAADRLVVCLADMGTWLKASRLRLNPTKTQVMCHVAGFSARLDIDEVPVLSSTIPVQQSARDLGVVIDSRLSLSEQVASVCRSGYYQLRACDKVCVKPSVARRWMPPRRWPGRLLPVAWTEWTHVTRSTTAYPTS